MSLSSRRAFAACAGVETGVFAFRRLVRLSSFRSSSASCWAKTGARTASGMKTCSWWAAQSRSPSFFEAVSTFCRLPPSFGRNLSSRLILKRSVAPESRFIVPSSSSRLCTNGLTLSSEPAGAFCARIVFEAASMSVMARTVRRSRSTRLTGQPRLAIDVLAFSHAASAVRVHLSSAARFSCAVGPSGPPPHPASHRRQQDHRAKRLHPPAPLPSPSPPTGYPQNAHPRLLRTAERRPGCERRRMDRSGTSSTRAPERAIASSGRAEAAGSRSGVALLGERRCR